MKVFVTGATGFVGGWLVKELVQQGHQVSCLVRSPEKCDDLNDLDIELLKGDVTDLDSIVKNLQSTETVFHLAGVVGYSRAARHLMDQVNVQGTKNVIEAMKTKSVTKMVYMSSVVAIGASFDGKQPLDESSKYNIKHLNLGYFETKRLAEEAVFAANSSGEIQAVAVNPSTIYGPGDAKKGSRKTQLKVAQGKFPFYTSGGVSIISVRDVITATLTAWEKGRNGERYILSGENITIKKLFEIIAELAGVDPPKIYLPNPVVHGLGKVGDFLENVGKKGPINSENAWTSTMFHWFSNEKAKRDLNLQPMNARQAIAESVGWIKQQGMI